MKVTREIAIKLIDDRMCFGRGNWSKHHQPVVDEYWEAGQMAIKALTQTPIVNKTKAETIDKEKITDYIKWLLSQIDEIASDEINKGTVKSMLLSIIGEMYSHT